MTKIPTDELYEQWASTYDTDGNMLQAVDDMQLRELLPAFVELVRRNSDLGKENAVRILDLGCGTGRNTLKLLQQDWRSGRVDATGWDASPAMLDLARAKCAAARGSSGVSASVTKFEVLDFSTLSNVPDTHSNVYDAVVSTLVLEHIPAETYFAVIAKVLKPGAYALITNMHPDQGRISAAGYTTEMGEKVRGESYVHTVEGAVEAAQRAGLEVVDEVREVEVDEGMIANGLVGDRGRKWVGVKVWFGMVIRKGRV